MTRPDQNDAETAHEPRGAWRGLIVLLICVFLAISGLHMATGMLRNGFPAVRNALSKDGGNGK